MAAADAMFARSIACFMVIVLCAIPGAAGAGKPKGAVDCSLVVNEMNDCVDYVIPWSKVSEPGAACCKGVENVVKVSPWCLCEILHESTALEVQVDMARADMLPSACKITIPDLGECKGKLPISPVTAPGSDEEKEDDATAADAPVIPTVDTIESEAPTTTASATPGGPASAPGSASSAITLSSHCIRHLVAVGLAGAVGFF